MQDGGPKASRRSKTGKRTCQRLEWCEMELWQVQQVCNFVEVAKWFNLKFCNPDFPHLEAVDKRNWRDILGIIALKGHHSMPCWVPWSRSSLFVGKLLPASNWTWRLAIDKPTWRWFRRQMSIWKKKKHGPRVLSKMGTEASESWKHWNAVPKDMSPTKWWVFFWASANQWPLSGWLR